MEGKLSRQLTVLCVKTFCYLTEVQRRMARYHHRILAIIPSDLLSIVYISTVKICGDGGHDACKARETVDLDLARPSGAQALDVRFDPLD